MLWWYSAKISEKNALPTYFSYSLPSTCFCLNQGQGVAPTTYGIGGCKWFGCCLASVRRLSLLSLFYFLWCSKILHVDKVISILYYVLLQSYTEYYFVHIQARLLPFDQENSSVDFVKEQYRRHWYIISRYDVTPDLAIARDKKVPGCKKVC